MHDFFSKLHMFQSKTFDRWPFEHIKSYSDTPISGNVKWFKNVRYKHVNDEVFFKRSMVLMKSFLNYSYKFVGFRMRKRTT